MATQTEVAEHLGISQPKVSDLIRRGILATRGRGGVDLDEARITYIRHLQAQAAGRIGGESSPLDLTTERARLAKEQADAQAMRNAEDRGDLVSTTAIADAWQRVMTEVRTKLLSIGADVAPHLADGLTTAERQSKIDERVHDVLAALQRTEIEGVAGDDEEADERPRKKQEKTKAG